MLTENIVKLAEVLDLTEDVWRSLQVAKVISIADIQRIKVLVIILHTIFEYLAAAMKTKV